MGYSVIRQPLPFKGIKNESEAYMMKSIENNNYYIVAPAELINELHKYNNDGLMVNWNNFDIKDHYYSDWDDEYIVDFVDHEKRIVVLNTLE